MNEIRELKVNKVRAACINNEWYTAGDCDDYNNLFVLIRNLPTGTTETLEMVATDIKEHSDTEDEIKDIMFVLANECCITYFE